MHPEFISILAIIIFAAEFCLLAGGSQSDDEVYYRNCSSVFPSPIRIKCVGYPFGCITKENCAWMGNVIDDGEQLTSNILDKISGVVYNAGGDPSIQYISGISVKTLDESMTKIVCRRPQIEDVKFFFFSNDTQLIKKIDASTYSTSVFTGYTNKSKYLETCTEMNIPISKNPKHDFNLRYFLIKYLSGGSTPEYAKSQYAFADTIEYSIDPTKMLYHTNFQEVPSSASINIFTTCSIIMLCIVASFFPI